MYAIEIYANCTAKAISKLNILNNKIIRTILNMNIRTPIATLYLNCKVLPINKLFAFNILLLVHKVLTCKSQLPIIFQNYFKPLSQIHNYTTRGNNKVYLNSSTNSFSHRTIKFTGALLYNKLPNRLRQLTMTQFKHQLWNYLTTNDI